MENMRKIVVHYHTGYVGQDGIEFVEVDYDMSNIAIMDEVYHAAIEHAEMYGVYPPNYEEDNDSEDDSNVSQNIEGWFEDYNSDKHDGQVPGGGNPQFVQW